jgi:class 3 adenylate cyclase
MSGMVDRGHLHPITLRFVDSDLEAGYQTEEGAAGLSGYRIITGATVLLWALATVLFPLGTEFPAEPMRVFGGLMSLVGLACFLFSRWAVTMNSQHLIASFLTSANGLVIILLASIGGVLGGYAVAGIMLLFAFGFVSRTRFVFAAARTFVIAVGFGVAVAAYDGPDSLLIDSFIFIAAGIGSLLALRLLERDRRRVWYQRGVIEEQTTAIEREKAESERLLLNVLPASVSLRLKQGEYPIADRFPSVSVVFADIVGFTPLSARLTAGEVITLLSELFTHYDDLVAERSLEKIKTIGDAYMAVGGLPEPMEDHAEKTIDLALAMIAATGPEGRWPDLKIRVGVHSGPAAGGVIGSRKFAYDVWGDTVNVASRLEQAGLPGRVHVSEHTRFLASPRYEFEARGSVQLRGLPAMTTYFVLDGPLGGNGLAPGAAGSAVDAGRVGSEPRNGPPGEALEG